MYYLVTYRNYGEHKVSLDGFEEIKREVVRQLDGRGWDDKSTVDLRSISSCLYYLFDDFDLQKTTSLKKYLSF